MDTQSKGGLLINLEKDIAELLITKLENQEMTVERASLIAKFVLKLLPEGLSDEQVLNIIPKLDDEFFELAEIVNKYISEYEEKYGPVVMQKANQLAKEGHFDEAKKLMSEYMKKITNSYVAKPEK